MKKYISCLIITFMIMLLTACSAASDISPITTPSEPSAPAETHLSTTETTAPPTTQPAQQPPPERVCLEEILDGTPITVTVEGNSIFWKKTA